MLRKQRWQFPSFLAKESLTKVRWRAWQQGLPYPTFALGTTITASAEGITIWTGYVRPTQYMRLPWQSISDVRGAEMYFDGYRYRGIEVTSSEFADGTIQLILQSKKFMGLFPISWKMLVAAEAHLRSSYFPTMPGQSTTGAD